MDHTSGRFLSSLARLSTGRAIWVVGAWLAIVVGLNVGIPQLESVVAGDSTSVVPEEAPSVITIDAMDEIFGNGESASYVYVALEREGGLTRADRRWFKELVPQLRADTDNVTFVQDVAVRPSCSTP